MEESETSKNVPNVRFICFQRYKESWVVLVAKYGYLPKGITIEKSPLSMSLWLLQLSLISVFFSWWRVEIHRWCSLIISPLNNHLSFCPFRFFSQWFQWKRWCQQMGTLFHTVPKSPKIIDIESSFFPLFQWWKLEKIKKKSAYTLISHFILCKNIVMSYNFF